MQRFQSVSEEAGTTLGHCRMGQSLGELNIEPAGMSSLGGKDNGLPAMD
jgi:hypothetical protein